MRKICECLSTTSFDNKCVMCKDELEKERKDWEIIYTIMEVFLLLLKLKILMKISYKKNNMLICI